LRWQRCAKNGFVGRAVERQLDAQRQRHRRIVNGTAVSHESILWATRAALAIRAGAMRRESIRERRMY
jgi:hypothetical protein